MRFIQARSYAAIGLLAMLLPLTGCSKTVPAQEVIPTVRAQAISLVQTTPSASYSGDVRGRYETQLAFQVGGKIIKRDIELGSAVKAGDRLLEIDPQDIQQAVNAYAAQLASARSQLNLAKSNLERFRQLYEQNAVSRLQFDQYQSAYDSAEAAFRQASAQYAQGTNQLGYSTLYADTSGVVAGIHAETGQIVGAGQAVVTLVRNGEREIAIDIPENRVEELRDAGQIRISFWALPDVVIDGRLREISPVADKASRTYKARIALVDPPSSVQLGMTASVEILSSNDRSAVFVPLSSIYQTGDTPHVWVINSDQVSLRPVKIGAFGDETVQILDGLKDGETIVTAGVHKLREGQKVRITGDKP
ncbi:efflux RND transporter periplasmic adaptor subunit [Acetonema longum]|uniref:ArcE n=1 Tax=Acetonema longum DSM 6540 TaxID=1009370 RepID=F7NIQ4_9FIRM|nr:efflux RND transporter periplasmic adaptor subunit [Acetonema longum]EGO64027.1 ArcE [Acetonema longum DSM 6540]